MPNTKQKPEDELNPAKNVGDKKWSDKIEKNYGSSGSPSKLILENPTYTKDEPSDKYLKDYEDDAVEDGEDIDDSQEGIRSKEESGASWKTNVTESEANEPSGFSAFFGKKKNRGILATLAFFVAILGIIGALMSAAFGLVNLKETVVAQLSQRANNALNHRMNRVMAKKMSQDLTAGCTVKVKCRYKGMTKREIKKFNKRNAANGVRVVTEPSGIPGKHKVIAIETYELKNGAIIGPDGSVPGKTIKSYKAREIRSAFRNDPKIYKAGVTFYKSNVQYHAGNVARGMFKRVGVGLGKKKVSDGKGESEVEKAKFQQNALIDSVQGTGEHDMSESAAKKYEDVPDDVQDEVGNRTTALEEAGSDPSSTPVTPSPESAEFDTVYGKAANTIKNMGSGLAGAVSPNPFNFMMNYCTLRLLVQTANQVRKIDQTVQLLKYSMLFYTLADQIKAGDADGDTAATIGVAMSMLTNRDRHGLSAFDSMGYNWVTRGSVRPGSTEDVTKFQNGGSASGIFGSAVSATTSGLGPICKLANSTTLTVVLGAVTVFGVVSGFFTAGLGTAATTAITSGGKQGAKKFASKLIKEKVEEGITKIAKRKIAEKVSGKSKSQLAWKAINNKITRMGAVGAFFLFATGPIIETLARSESGTVTKGLVGPDPGNALIAGAGAENSKASQAQGLEIITADEAVSQDKKALTASLENSRLEGVNHLDIASQYGFANKLATLLMPGVSRLSSVVRAPTGLAALVSSAFGGIGQSAYAESTKKLQYTYCRDDQYENADTNIATDPFCNPQYGFDMAVIDGPEYDPEKVTDYIYNNNFVSEDGEPSGELADFISVCMETEASIGQDEEGNIESECLNRDKKHRMMRLYCLDSSIDSDMQEEIIGNCATQDELATGDNGATAEGSGQWSGQTDITSDLKAFLDEVAKYTSYEPICTTSTGGTHAVGSDHYSGNACDFGSAANEFGTDNAQPGVSVPKGDELAAAALIAAGVDPDEAKRKAKQGLTPGTDDVTATISGKTLRVQVIWKSEGHYDHVHIGVKKQ
ncbi:MAG: hypothetical protein AAB395_01855 [Patescibacteria group bacterium]